MGLSQISGWEFWCFSIDFLFVDHKVSFINSKKSTFLRGVYTYVHTCIHLQKHPGPSMSECSHFHRDTYSNVLTHAPNAYTHALLTVKWIQCPSTSDPEVLRVSSQPAFTSERQTCLDLPISQRLSHPGVSWHPVLWIILWKHFGSHSNSRCESQSRWGLN